MAGNKGMEALIPMINKLQDVYTSLGRPLELDLPQIAVVGSQSAGKSSVLENFVGRDFLPRGSGIVTRRPLILQLVNDTTEYGEFLHCRDKKFTDFDAIRREIEAETDRLTGSNKGISNIPINLKIHSPNVLTLTLIDLPGMTKVPVGDQPPDIEMQIRNMITQYIEKENCLILAVSPANSDLANSDALKVAKEFDQEGLRTIGVLTKLDLMDQGTDAKEVLENRLLPLRRGYIGVVNRSQRDIDGRKDIVVALESERKFFLGHPSYRHMADRMGTPYLQQVLNQQLTNHIREGLPNMRNQLQAQLLAIDKDVQSFSRLMVDDKSSKQATFIRLARDFEAQFIQIIDGSGNVNFKQLSGGAELNKILTERYNLLLHEVRYDEEELRKEINIVIQNIHGIRMGLFTPDLAFDTTVRRLIEMTRKPTVACLDIAVSRLLSVIQECSQTAARYPNLQNEFVRQGNARVRELEVLVQQQLETFIDVQLAYINTNHEDFIGFKNAEKGVRNPGHGELGNQVICKGWLTLNNPNVFRGGSRYFWFILTTETLKWYKDDEERELKYTLQLEGIRQRAGENKFLAKKNTFSLLYGDPKMCIYKDHKSLDLSADTQDAAEAWKAALLRAGVLLEMGSNKEPEKPDDAESTEGHDPKLARQVEIIRNLVDSYMKLFYKTMRDTFPKIVIYGLINKFKSFLEIELVTSFNINELDRLMVESETEKQRRSDLLKMQRSLKEALDLMIEIMSNTRIVEPPPPVKNDWLVASRSDTAGDTAASEASYGSANSLSVQQPAQRPVTPPPRPMPSRPAPNLPKRDVLNPALPKSPASSVSGQLPPPLVPQRAPLGGNAYNDLLASSPAHLQSASTGNLPMALSTANKLNGSLSNSHLLAMMSQQQQLPLQQQQQQQQQTQPNRPGQVSSLASAFSAAAAAKPQISIPERPSGTSTPRIPPRPN